MSEFVAAFLVLPAYSGAIILRVNQIMTLNRPYYLIAIAALGLTGCGSGTTTSSTPQSGQPVITSVLVDGVEVSSKTYTVYGVVDSEGTLSDKPLAETEEAKLSHVLILASSRSNKGPTAQLSTEQYKSCYYDFWKSIRRQLPNSTIQQVVQRLNDFDMTIDEVCDRQRASGLTVDEYVELYRIVAKYWPTDPDIDGKIARFFTNLGVSPSVFKATLTGLGYTWEDFVKRLSSVAEGASKFTSEYAVSALVLEAFLNDYMTRPNPVLAAAQAKMKLASAYMVKDMNPQLVYLAGARQRFAQAADTSTSSGTSGKLIDTIKDWINLANDVATGNVIGAVIKVGNTAWTFIKNNQGIVEGVKGDISSKVLSAIDNVEYNYQYAKASRSSVVSIVGKRLINNDWETYRTDLQLSADYGATHPDFGGQWIPDLRVIVKKIDAPFGYTLGGEAKLNHLVNRGSVAEPIPEVQVDVTITAKSFGTRVQTVTFSANGATGAAYIE